MRSVLIEAIHRSTLARIAVGFGVVYVVLTFIVFGYNQVIEAIKHDAETRLEAAPAGDYFHYSDVRTTKDTFVVGEPITFVSTYASRGAYPVNYIDRIFCPDEPRDLIETAYSSQLLTKSRAPIKTRWTFGDFAEGAPFVVKLINEPKTNCISEHLIAVQVAPDTYKTQLFVNSTKFHVVEGE